jgi:hypothetical protein
MPDHFDPTLVDDSVTPEELDLAHAAPAGAFPLVDQDLVDLAPRALLAARPATPAQMLTNFRTMRDNHTPIGGVGLCLYNVRHFGWEIDALWPTANDAGQHGAPIHRVKNFADIPRAVTIAFLNDHQGHITGSLGGGLNNTSDYHELGFNGVATIANTADWCNATDVFWIETVNGVDVYPNPVKPKPQPKPFSRDERIAILRTRMHELEREHHPKRAARFERWIEQLQAAK